MLAHSKPSKPGQFSAETHQRCLQDRVQMLSCGFQGPLYSVPVESSDASLTLPAHTLSSSQKPPSVSRPTYSLSPPVLTRVFTPKHSSSSSSCQTPVHLLSPRLISICNLLPHPQHQTWISASSSVLPQPPAPCAPTVCLLGSLPHKL